MILFLGDSFTWGQGLEWEYLINNQGWSYERCNKNMPPHNSLERLPLVCQDFRLKNHWPRLVSQNFNHQYHLGRCGNGGSNRDLLNIIDNIEHHIHPENLDFIIIQLTHALRGAQLEGINSIDEFFESAFNDVKQSIDSFKQKYKNINILFISWIPEYSPIIKKNYGNESLVTFDFGNTIYESFDEFYERLALSKKYIEPNTGYNLIDNHFSLEGHQFVADNVIRHIKKYNLISPYEY
jgi:lysophospholipase L1-like esterase